MRSCSDTKIDLKCNMKKTTRIKTKQIIAMDEIKLQKNVLTQPKLS